MILATLDKPIMSPAPKTMLKPLWGGGESEVNTINHQFPSISEFKTDIFSGKIMVFKKMKIQFPTEQ